MNLKLINSLSLTLVEILLFSSHARASPYASAVDTEDPEEEPGSTGFWLKLLLSAGLVLAGGVFAGCVGLYIGDQPLLTSENICFCSLTLGLMGLDELHLRVLATSSDDLTEKRNAQKGSWLSS